MDLGKERDVSLSLSGVNPDTLKLLQVCGLTLRFAPCPLCHKLTRLASEAAAGRLGCSSLSGFNRKQSSGPASHSSLHMSNQTPQTLAKHSLAPPAGDRLVSYCKSA